MSYKTKHIVKTRSPRQVARFKGTRREYAWARVLKFIIAGNKNKGRYFRPMAQAVGMMQFAAAGWRRGQLARRRRNGDAVAINAHLAIWGRGGAR